MSAACKIKKDTKSAAPAWVPASHWLPAGSHEVLVTDMECIWMGQWDGDVWRDLDGREFDSVITHWMPLPELPDEYGAEQLIQPTRLP
jgi:hypothetical protein